MRLVVVRHGDTFAPGQVACWLGSDSDPSLAPQAISQAMRVRDFLAEKSLLPTVAYCGPLKRHREFLSLILKGTPCRWSLDERLQELDYGRWAGKINDEICEQEELAAWNTSCAWPASVGWSSSEQQVRSELKEMIEDLRSKHPQETVLFVSSNGRLRLLAKEYAPRDFADKSFKLKTGHIGLLEVEAGGVEIRFWNE